MGRRTFDDLVWSMEHEAAHLAFNLDSPLDRGPGDRADAVVRACHAADRRARASADRGNRGRGNWTTWCDQARLRECRRPFA
ncbi:MAG: hypothetical protein IPK33_11695 [Gemmatimonadetes bacterium]|nr:hypothetical protein [Gemmatimonadota bacterium]